jgi:boron transporter
MAQGTQFPLRKPPGFHYDFFLLGVTTFIAGLIGVPAPNGLIPQAPIHTTSLLIMGQPIKRDLEAPSAPRTGTTTPASIMKNKEVSLDASNRNRVQYASTSATPRPASSNADADNHSILHDQEHPPDSTDLDRHELPIAVVEQRVSNLAQGALCLVLLSGPFLHILHLIPRGVLAGLLCDCRLIARIY